MTERAGCVLCVCVGVCSLLIAAYVFVETEKWSLWLGCVFFSSLNDPAHSKLRRALFHHCAWESDCGIASSSVWIRAEPFVSSALDVSASCICRCVVAQRSSALWNKTAKNCIWELFSHKINVSHNTPVALDSLYLTYFFLFYCEFGAEKPQLLQLLSTIHMLSLQTRRKAAFLKQS